MYFDFALAFLFCVCTLGFVDLEIKYSDGHRFKWVGWISRIQGMTKKDCTNRGETFTEWLNNSEDYGIFAPPMEAPTAVDFLRRYLLGDNWYITYSGSSEQVNTEVVHAILCKYSEEYRKEYRKARKGQCG